MDRVLDLELDAETFCQLTGKVEKIGVTEGFRKVIQTFDVPEKEIPAGFEPQLVLSAGKTLLMDLKRNIAFDKNGRRCPTNLLFSADSANPYEVAPIAPFLANLTCNPGIIYDLFINNPKANIGHKFNTRDEVMTELGRILGPGCDISVELNDPFGKSDAEILEEAEHFRELLTEYRVVIKVPHTGPVNRDNVGQLLTGDKKLDRRYSNTDSQDAFRGHRLAKMLEEHGFRVNFTLMFDPAQTQLALQARPYFINSFIRHRYMQSQEMQKYLELFRVTDDPKYLEELRSFMVGKDYFAAGEENTDLFTVKKTAETILAQRHFNDAESHDGLDGIRHNLRVLRNCNMEDTRLILCSMEGDWNYYDNDQLLASDEFSDMAGRVVLTAEPNYLARFASSNQVVSYQRRFMNAANGAK